MTDRRATALGTEPVPAAKLEPDAIGVAQDTVIGMASSAPAASVGLTLAALAAATAYGSGPVLVLTAVPMLVIANAYRRCNLWNANCGASFEWVGRAINPYLGFLTGWLMIVGYVIGAVAGVEVIGPAVLALALALSVIAATGTNIVLTARITYGMASWRTLPPFLAQVSHRFATPVAASITTGVVLIGLTWVYLLATSVQGAFNAVVNVSGLLFAAFYILTALAMIAYYRRRVLAGAWDALVLGVLPLGAAGFLAWIIGKSILAAPAAQNWSLAGIVVAGVAVMLVARFGLRSGFFAIPRESEKARH
jgi:amino acid transporter